jgi:polyketide synthase 12/myxalamid-type polyketide synthase MxaB
MGGLGLASAGWLVDSGARSLVLMGRSGPDEEARAMIKTFESRGATVVPMRADVSSIAELERVAAYIHGSLPPVRGIVHAAGVLDDGAIVQQTWERFARVLAPKVSGTRNLERVFPLQCLDFLVCFSSLASVFGSRGQTNHAAANAFLDSLAHTRQAQGLPCVTINWGPWSEIGSAARHGVGNRAAEKGIGALAPETGLRILGRAIAERWIQRVVAPIDWRQFLRGVASPIAEGFFSYVRPVEERQAIPRQQTAADVSMLERMRAASPGHRRSLLVQHIRSCATRILGGGNASDIDLKRPLSEMGLDSLMAVELRNLLGSSLENRLPATVLFDYPSVDRLAGYLLGILFPAADSAAQEDGSSPMPSPKDVLTDLEHLSDEDVDRLIEERTKGES